MLTPDKWTVVAHRLLDKNYLHKWSWVQGYMPGELHKASDDNRVILMHNRDNGGGVQLVARLAGEQWRRWQDKGRGR